jgi:hypothetical protein
MERNAARVLPAVLHIRYFIFDWSIPNLIMGGVMLLLVIAAI